MTQRLLMILVTAVVLHQAVVMAAEDPEPSSLFEACQRSTGQAYVRARREFLRSPKDARQALAEAKGPTWLVEALMWRLGHPAKAKECDAVLDGWVPELKKLFEQGQKPPDTPSWPAPSGALLHGGPGVLARQIARDGDDALLVEWVAKDVAGLPFQARRVLIASIPVSMWLASSVEWEQDKPELLAEAARTEAWLCELASHKDPAVRWSAVWALGGPVGAYRWQYATTSRFRAVLNVLKGRSARDDCAAIRVEAGKSMFRLGTSINRRVHCLHGLREWLDRENSIEVRCAAIENLGDKADPMPTSVLVALDLESWAEKAQEPRIRTAARKARTRIAENFVEQSVVNLGYARSSSSEEALLALSRSESAPVRKAAIGGLLRLGTERALARLKQMATVVPDASVQADARSAVERLEAALESEEDPTPMQNGE